METVLAMLVGLMSSLGLHLMLTRSFVKVVLGLGLLSNAVNIVVFAAAGLTRGVPALSAPDGSIPADHADPIAQALVLTAIVINFAIQAFALVLVYRVFQAAGTDDPDALVASEVDDDMAPQEDGR